MVSKPFSLYVSPKIMEEVEASQSMRLKVPADANQKGVGENASYSWIELLKVVGSSVAPSKKNKDVQVFEIKFQIPDDTPFVTNLGRPYTVWYRINTAALAAGEANDGQRKMSIISIGALKNIARAATFIIEDGVDVDIASFFVAPDEDSLPPVVGARMYVRLIDKPGEDKEGNKLRNQEPRKFVAEAELKEI